MPGNESGWLEIDHIDALVADWAWVNEQESLAEQKYAIQVEHLRRTTQRTAAYFGGVAVHGTPKAETITNFANAGFVASYFMDVIMTSGPRPFALPPLTQLRELFAYAGPVPLCLGAETGISRANVGPYLEYVRIFMVDSGVALKDRPLDFDPVELRRFIALVAQAESTPLWKVPKELVQIPPALGPGLGQPNSAREGGSELCRHVLPDHVIIAKMERQNELQSLMQNENRKLD